MPSTTRIRLQLMAVPIATHDAVHGSGGNGLSCGKHQERMVLPGRAQLAAREMTCRPGHSAAGAVPAGAAAEHAQAGTIIGPTGVDDQHSRNGQHRDPDR